MRKLFALFAFLFAGCESDAAKLQRLQGDLALTELTVYNLEAEIYRVSGQAAYDSIQEVMDDAHEALMNLEGRAFINAFETPTARSKTSGNARRTGSTSTR